MREKNYLKSCLSYSHGRLLAGLFVLAFNTPSIALDSLGRLAVAGTLLTDQQDLRDSLIAVTRYTTGGQIDTTFGDGGLATVPNIKIGSGINAPSTPLLHGVAQDIAYLSGNRIVVVGTAIRPETGKPQSIVVMFDSSGALDTTFNTNGAFALGNSGYVWLNDSGKGSVANGTAIGEIEGRQLITIVGSLIGVDNRYYGYLAALELNGSAFLEATPIDTIDTKLNSLFTTTPIALTGTISISSVGKSIANGSPQPLQIAALVTQDSVPFQSSVISDISGELRDTTLFVAAQGGASVGVHQNKGLLIITSPSGTEIVTDQIGNKATEFNAVTSDLAQGDLVVCGTARSLQNRMFIARYNASGNRVSSWGDNGIVTIQAGPNIQTQGVDVVLPIITQFGSGVFIDACPTGSDVGLFAVANANGQTPFVANLACSGGTLQFNAYGDKGIASLETEQLSSMTVLKEIAGPSGLSAPTQSPYVRRFNSIAGNTFEISLTGSRINFQPGRYFIDAQAPISDVGSHNLALYNTNLDLIEAEGGTVWNSSGILTIALLKSSLFVSEPTLYELQHFFANTGLGFSVGSPASISGLATTNVYAQMNIEQL